MRYPEWHKLSNDEKKAVHWKQHPRIRLAKLFSVLFIVVFFIFLLRVLQNRRVHVNRKPNVKEAFFIAKAFVKDNLKQPATSNFPDNDFQSYIDTVRNVYRINSVVNAQDSTGMMTKNNWQVKMAYKGGDWSEKTSWALTYLQIKANK